MNIFLLKSLIAWLIAWIWVIFITFLTEKKGTKLGWLIGALPSTLLVLMIFVAITQWVDIAAESSYSVVYGLMSEIFFLMAFVYFGKKHTLVVLILSILFRFFWAYVFWSVHFSDLYIAVLFYFLLTFLSIFVIERYIPSRSMTWSPITLTWWEVLIRWWIAFFAVFGVSYASWFLSPIWIWIFSMFPATFLSTLYILHTRKWVVFSQATAKVFILWMTSLLIYWLITGYTYPIIWIIWWTILWCIWSLLRTLGMRKIINTLS